MPQRSCDSTVTLMILLIITHYWYKYGFGAFRCIITWTNLLNNITTTLCNIPRRQLLQWRHINMELDTILPHPLTNTIYSTLFRQRCQLVVNEVFLVTTSEVSCDHMTTPPDGTRPKWVSRGLGYYISGNHTKTVANQTRAALCW